MLLHVLIGDNYKIFTKYLGHNSKIIKEDEILAVNDFRIDNNLEHWLNYFENDNIVLKVSRNGKILDINMNSSNDIQYFKYKCSEE